MGFPLFDFFTKTDPLEFNFRLLILNGFWPIETKNKTVQVLYSIYSFLCCFSPISMFFIQILDLYMLRNDLFTLTKNLCATSVTFAAVVKHVIIFFQVDNVQKLHKTLEAFKKSRKDSEEVKILEKADQTISYVTKAIYGLGLPCITAWMLYPGLESSKQKRVPFPYRLPTDDWSTPIYEILYTYQSLSMIGFMVLVLSNDLVYYGFVIRVNAEYEILMRKLESLEGPAEEGGGGGRHDPSVTEKARLLVRDCSSFHQDILQKIEELKAIYGNPYLIHFIAAVLLMGSIIMDIVLVSKGFKLQMLQRIIYSATGLFDTYLCCLFTTQMQEKSYELARTVYSSPWYELSPGVRRDLLMISMKSLKAPAVRIGHFFPLNLSTFLQYLKVSYNITALLYQTIRR